LASLSFYRSSGFLVTTVALDTGFGPVVVVVAAGFFVGPTGSLTSGFVSFLAGA
jgi:hypothetical protein